MALKLITFKTNQTLLGDVEPNLDAEGTIFGIKLKQPVQVVVQPSKEGNMMGFAPFLEYCEEFKTGIFIDINDVLTTTTPVVELINQYNNLFGAGIQIAQTIPR